MKDIVFWYEKGVWYDSKLEQLGRMNEACMLELKRRHPHARGEKLFELFLEQEMPDEYARVMKEGARRYARDWIRNNHDGALPRYRKRDRIANFWSQTKHFNTDSSMATDLDYRWLGLAIAIACGGLAVYKLHRDRQSRRGKESEGQADRDEALESSSPSSSRSSSHRLVVSLFGSQLSGLRSEDLTVSDLLTDARYWWLGTEAQWRDVSRGTEMKPLEESDNPSDDTLLIGVFSFDHSQNPKTRLALNRMIKPLIREGHIECESILRASTDDIKAVDFRR